jgi:tripartite-type tricarboxylate transporter receptor subunit TctC
MRLTKTASTFGLAASASLFLATASFAASYPTHPVRIIVGFTAGGPTDVPARFVASKLSTALGKRVIVEDKPGAGSMLAARAVMEQPADGYTLLACTYFDPVNTLLYKDPGYKVADIAPVSLLATYDYAIAVPNDSPIKSISDLVGYAKKNPGKLTYGLLGIGSTQNLLAKRLETLEKIKLRGIPYQGAANAVQDVMAGRLGMYAGPPVSIIPLYKAKKLRILAVTGKKRLSAAPSVPTLMESHIPIDAFGWIGLCARSGTPKSIIDLLNSKVVKIVKSPGFQRLITKSGSIPAPSTPAQMQAVIDQTVKDNAPLIAKFHLQMK